MGLTQHAHGVDTIKALVNVGLARGLPGPAESRPGADSRTLGRAGRRGGWLRAGRRCRDRRALGGGVGISRCRRTAGWTAAEMVEHAAGGDIDVFWIVGGNFLETLPDTDAVAPRARASARCASIRTSCSRRRCSSRPTATSLILPATTRYESPGGGTETSTERRIIFSPEIPGPSHRIGAAGVVGVRRGDGARAPGSRQLHPLRERRGDPAGDRARRAALRRHRDARSGRAIRCSGAGRRCTRTAASPRRTARRTSRRAVSVRTARGAPAGELRVSTRRGKQFNSMVQREVDPLTGARPRRHPHQR